MYVAEVHKTRDCSDVSNIHDSRFCFVTYQQLCRVPYKGLSLATMFWKQNSHCRPINPTGSHRCVSQVASFRLVPPSWRSLACLLWLTSEPATCVLTSTVACQQNTLCLDYSTKRPFPSPLCLFVCSLRPRLHRLCSTQQRRTIAHPARKTHPK